VLVLAAAWPAAGLEGRTSADSASPAGGDQTRPAGGCVDRVESEPIVPDRARDTVIGPVAFYRLPALFDPEAQSRAGGGPRFVPVKALALVNSGKRVTMLVPRRQRQWMRLFYLGHSAFAGGSGHSAVTLEACERVRSHRAQRRECRWKPYRACRSDTTQFAGEIALDYNSAPRQGRCAMLVVRVEGRHKPLRRRVFRPAHGTCT
jgi:hypothetical protein